jgi:hypothetical protein
MCLRLFKEGYEAVSNFIDRDRFPYGHPAGYYSHQTFAHQEDGKITISALGKPLLVLYPDNSLELNVEHGDPPVTVINQALSHAMPEQKLHMGLKSVRKSGRVYQLLAQGKELGEFNYKLRIKDVTAEQLEAESINKEVIEDLGAKKEWFALIKNVRRVAKTAVRVVPFKTSQRRIRGELKQSQQWKYYQYRLDENVIMDLIKQGDGIMVASHAVAEREYYTHVNNDTTIPPQDQLKAIDNLFNRMTKKFHKGNISLV